MPKIIKNNNINLMVTLFLAKELNVHNQKYKININYKVKAATILHKKNIIR